MSNYTINSVNGKREFESKYGPLVSYKVTITGDDGYNGDAEMTRKPESPAPTAGETIEGTLDKSNPKFPPKLKKIPGMGGAPGRAPGRSNKDSQSIERQVAFKGAVELIVATLDPSDTMPEDLVCERMTHYFDHGLSLIQGKPIVHSDQSVADVVKQAFPGATEVEQPVSDKELAEAYKSWSNGRAAMGEDEATIQKRIQQKKLALGVSDMADADDSQRRAMLSFLTSDV
jgi:hypothetical protein